MVTFCQPIKANQLSVIWNIFCKDKKNNNMSIPKEPRQLMINVMYIVLTALLALNVSAEVFNAFDMVRDGLARSSSAALDKSNAEVPAVIKKRAEANR
jgi:hypothetical protein